MLVMRVDVITDNYTRFLLLSRIDHTLSPSSTNQTSSRNMFYALPSLNYLSELYGDQPIGSQSSVDGGSKIETIHTRPVPFESQNDGSEKYKSRAFVEVKGEGSRQARLRGGGLSGVFVGSIQYHIDIAS
jgi:hypothetical protein